MRTSITPERAVRQLLDPKRRSTLDRLVGGPPDPSWTEPGLYAWFADEAGAQAIGQGLDNVVAPGLVYAGQAGAGRSRATLWTRLKRNHIGGNVRASTFRLTLAAVVGPTIGLEGVGGRLSAEGERRLSEWMADHLSVATVPYPDRLVLDAFETDVLALLDPPLNLDKRPPTPERLRLRALRHAFMRGGAG